MRFPRLLLLFPPPADPAQPYSSLPTLAAFLEREGCEVVMADLAIEAIHHLLSREHLEDSARRVKCSMAEFAAGGEIPAGDASRYLRGAAVLGVLDHVSEMTGVPAELQKPETFSSLEGFTSAVKTLDRALQLASAASFPIGLSRHHLDAGIDVWEPRALSDALTDSASIPLYAWLRERVQTLVEASAPDLVGVSLVYPDQLLPSLILLSAVRETNRSICTCLGGPTVTRLAPRLERLGGLMGLIDAAVVGEGEEAVLRIARRVLAGRPLAGIHNVLVPQADGSVERGPMAVSKGLDNLPTPVYQSLELDRYLAPEPVLLLNTSRGCYWGRCAFCDVSGSSGERYRQRSVDRVAEDIRLLREQTGTRHFMFGDLSMSPARLLHLVRALKERELDVRWLCQARLEPGFTEPVLNRLAQGGCRGLVFGLESANQRLLDRMHKGTHIADAEHVLRACSAAGISVNLQAFVGFPGESEDEARATSDFLVSQRPWVTSASLTSFRLIDGTRALEEASGLGIENPRQSEDRLEAFWDYDVASGLCQDRATELARKIGADLRATYPILDSGLSWNAYALLLASRRGAQGLRPSPPLASAAVRKLRLRPGLKITRLPYHVGELAARGQAEEGNGATPRRETWTVVDRNSGLLVPLDEISHQLLQTSARGRLEPEVSTRGPGDLKSQGRLLRLLELGLLVHVPSSRPAFEDRVR